MNKKNMISFLLLAPAFAFALPEQATMDKLHQRCKSDDDQKVESCLFKNGINTFSRQKAVLKISTDSGLRSFKDNPTEGENFSMHFYTDYLPFIKTHVVSVTHYEWTSTLLVPNSGVVVEVGSNYKISPDAQKVFWIDAGEEVSGAGIVDMKTNKSIWEFPESFTGGAYINPNTEKPEVKWISDTEIELAWDCNYDHHQKSLRIKQLNGQWKLLGSCKK